MVPRPTLAGLVLAFLLPLTASSARATEPAAPQLPTREKPLVVDKVAKRVLLYTEVNQMHLYLPSVHWGVVFKDAKFADRAILKSWAGHLEFHDALLQIGAKPGDMKRDAVGKAATGDELSVTVTWPGLNKEIAFADAFADKAGKGFRFRFAGNRATAAEVNTGCLTCLTSCWVGITSNAQYPTATTPEVYSAPASLFNGRPDVLPAKDNAPVTLIYTLKPSVP